MTSASLIVVRLSEAGRVLLADGGSSPTDIDPTTGKGPEWGKAAPIGLLVIVLLCVACYFLARSFSRNLKKVPASFDPDAVEPGDETGAAESVESSAAPGAAAPRRAAPAGRAGAGRSRPGKANRKR